MHPLLSQRLLQPKPLALSRIFPPGQSGFYSPLKLLYQTTDTSTPADAIGDPVGRIEDISGNGNHLLQSSATARGKKGKMPRGGRVNLLATNGTPSEDYSDSRWAKSGATVSAGTVADFSTITDGSAAAREYINAQVTTGSGVSAYAQIKVLKDTDQTRFPLLNMFSSGGVNAIRINTQTGDYYQTQSSNALPVTVTDGGDHWLAVFGITTGGTVTNLRIFPADALTLDGAQSDAATGSIEISAVQISHNADGPYQKVSAAWDITQSGLPSLPLVWHDGLDDYEAAALPAPVDLSNGCFIALAVQHNTGVASGNNFAIALGSSSSDNPFFGLQYRSAEGKISASFRDDATPGGVTTALGPNIDAALHVVLLWVQGTTMVLRVDGIEYTQTVSGSCTVNRLAVGALVRASASNFAAASIIGDTIVRFGPVPSTQEILQVERSIANKVGVTLP